MAAKDEVEAGRRLIILILKRGLPALLQKLQQFEMPEGVRWLSRRAARTLGP